MRQGDKVLVSRDARNLDPRRDEPDEVPAGTTVRIAGWRGLDGVVVTWEHVDWGTQSAVVDRRSLTAVGHGHHP